MKHIMDKYTLNFSGGTIENIGCAVATIYYNNEKILYEADIVEENNSPDYCSYIGLILGLNLALENNISHLKIYGSNKSVIERMNKTLQINDNNLMTLYEIATELISQFKYIEFNYIKK